MVRSGHLRRPLLVLGGADDADLHQILEAQRVQIGTLRDSCRERRGVVGAAGIGEAFGRFSFIQIEMLPIEGNRSRECRSRPAGLNTSGLAEGQESRLQCAGVNRHEAENARFSRQRSSGPLGLESCAAGREVPEDMVDEYLDKDIKTSERATNCPRAVHEPR